MIQALISRYLVYALIALALATVGTGYGWYHTIQRLAVANAAIGAAEEATRKAVAARKTAVKVLAAERARYTRLQAKAQAAEASLAAALAANPTWDSQTVPLEVQNALR